MNLELDGHVALVTGSSSGLGAVMAHVLAAEGASVVVHGRDQRLAGAVAKSILGTGGRAIAIAADVSTDEGAQALATGAANEFGRVDILVNNVGITPTRRGHRRAPTTGWRSTTPTSARPSGSSGCSSRP